MRECENAAVRDLLPDLVAGAATGPGIEAARAHVASCEACRDEMALLASVRGAARVPRVDAARIAAAIPPYRAAPAWSRWATSPALRIAAAILLVAGAGSLFVDAPRRAAPDTADARPAMAAGAGELEVGTPLAELSEADLQSLLGELGDLEAVTSTDEDVVVIPAFDRNGA